MFYGAQVWDPVLIVAQIVTLQCLFYLSLGALLFVFVGAPPARPRRQRPGQLDRLLELGRTACCTLSLGGALSRLLATHTMSLPSTVVRFAAACNALAGRALPEPVRLLGHALERAGAGLARCGGLGERCACGGQGPAEARHQTREWSAGPRAADAPCGGARPLQGPG